MFNIAITRLDRPGLTLVIYYSAAREPRGGERRRGWLKRQTMAITAITEAILLSAVQHHQWRTYWIYLGLSQTLMLVPLALEARKVILLPWPIVLGAALSLLLHGLGLVTEWYYTVFWWDKRHT